MTDFFTLETVIPPANESAWAEVTDRGGRVLGTWVGMPRDVKLTDLDIWVMKVLDRRAVRMGRFCVRRGDDFQRDKFTYVCL